MNYNCLKIKYKRISILSKCIYLYHIFFSSGSLWDFICVEFTRGYSLENDEKEFSDRREKVYTFMKIPLEVERFMFYGFCQVCIYLILFYYLYSISSVR